MIVHEGISKVRYLSGDEAAGPLLQKLKSGASLAELTQDYAFFTYAPLFLFGGLEHNPIQEWINLNNYPQVVFIFSLDAPVLDLGANEKWDRLLWAAEKSHWKSLALHIGNMAFIDRGQKRFTRVICQDIPILDVASKGKLLTKETSPLVTVTTFAIDSNIGCLAFAPGKPLQNQRPNICLYPPRNETVKLAAALLAEHPKPYEGIQPFPWEINNESSNSPTSSV